MPEIKTIIFPNELEKKIAGLTLGDLKRKAKDYYKSNLNGKVIKNADKGITVSFAMSGQRHLLYARNAGC